MKLEIVKQMIEHTAACLECDDRLPECLVIEQEDGGLIEMGILPDSSLAPLARQQTLCAIIVKAIKGFDGCAACHIAPRWEFIFPTADEQQIKQQADEGTLYERPDKVEVVLCTMASRNGYGDGDCMAVGRVIRSADHPRISWREDDRDCQGVTGGTMKALQRGVRKNTRKEAEKAAQFMAACVRSGAATRLF